MPKYIIVDIDHTLSDARWRDHLLPVDGASASDEAWNMYYRDQERDALVDPVAKIVCNVSLLNRWDVVAVTGRPERFRDVTLRWIGKHCLPIYEVRMRPDGDKTKTVELKTRMIKEAFPDLSEIAFIIEDRGDCVLEYRRKLKVLVLQVYA